MQDTIQRRPIRVLSISYSQTGQLDNIVKAITTPITERGITVVHGRLHLDTQYPFPWPFLQFFNQFPETVYEDGETPLLVDLDDRPIEDTDFDLIVLGYQVWFLAPSLPVSSFLKGDYACRLFRGKR